MPSGNVATFRRHDDGSWGVLVPHDLPRGNHEVVVHRKDGDTEKLKVRPVTWRVWDGHKVTMCEIIRDNEVGND